MSEPFDFNKSLKALQSGQALTGKDGVLTPLIKQLTEAAFAAGKLVFGIFAARAEFERELIAERTTKSPWTERRTPI